MLFGSKKYKLGPRANLYANNDFLYFETVSGIDISVVDPEGQKFLLSPDEGVSEIGKSLRNCLKASRGPKYRHAPELYNYRAIAESYKVWRNEMMLQFNYKTQKYMFSKMKLISFQERDGFIQGQKMTLENIRKQGWIDSQLEPLRLSSELSSDDIGAKILEYIWDDAQ